jgi:hypothetical protein
LVSLWTAYIKCLWQSQNLLGVLFQPVYKKWKPAC